MQQTITQPLTYDDLVNTPDDGQRYEIIDGEMIVSASPNRAHQESRSAALSPLVDASDRWTPSASFTSPPSMSASRRMTSSNPICSSSAENACTIYTDIGIVEGPPDIVVEILSPTSHYPRPRSQGEALRMGPGS